MYAERREHTEGRMIICFSFGRKKKRGRASWSALLKHLPHAGHTRTHALQAGSELWILLLHLQLRPRGLSIGEGIDDFTFGSGELGGALEVLEGVSDLALLEEELCHGGDGDIAFGID